MNRATDALVVGAGAAGLAAAREISRAGLSVRILEARDRIGGRILTVRAPGSPLPVELGAEFVHGEEAETLSIVRAARLPADEIPENHLRSRGGRLTPISGFWELVEKTTRAIGRTFQSNGHDSSFLDYLRRARLAGGRRRLLVQFVEGFHAPHVDRISARSLASTGGGNRQFRLPGGNDGVIEALRGALDPDRVELRLNTIATEVRWRAGAVILGATSGTGRRLDPFRAKAAVIALPHAVLRAGDLRFSPSLPEKERAARRLEVGQVFRIVLRFREAFWEDGEFVRRRLKRDGELGFVHGGEEEVPVWWTPLPARAPLLTGWAGGPRAERLLDRPPRERLDRSLDSLGRILAVPRRALDELLESCAFHDWRADPFSRGAYSYVGVGGLAAQRALARPVDGTLFFAGDTLDPDETGTVAGALSTGRRAGAALARTLLR